MLGLCFCGLCRGWDDGKTEPCLFGRPHRVMSWILKNIRISSLTKILKWSLSTYI